MGHKGAREGRDQEEGERKKRGRRRDEEMLRTRGQLTGEKRASLQIKQVEKARKRRIQMTQNGTAQIRERRRNGKERKGKEKGHCSS
jgi:hypothetical protein